ncbi:substrate-binding and VWA domain-containing protein [Marinactinospora endophytica]
MGRHRGNSPDEDDHRPRRRSGRSRRRRGRGGAITAFAAAFAVLLGLGVTGWVLIDRQGGCGREDISLKVLAASELSPVLTRIASSFNAGEHSLDGRCVQVEVRGADSANVAYGISGAGPTMGDTSSHVWIPDSSLWPSLVERSTENAVLTDTGTAVAHSPLVLALPREAAEDGEATSWATLVPTDTATPGNGGYDVRLIDPVRSSSGLATLALIKGAIGDGQEQQARLIAAFQGLQQGVATDEEAAFSALSGDSGDASPVLVLSEQAAWRYNNEHENAPAHVNYPEGGTYTLDYPYLLRTDDPLLSRAAEAFRAELTGDDAQSLIRGEGFRSADGTADTEVLRSEAGFQKEIPAELPSPSGGAVEQLTRAWNQLKLNTRMLTVLDISGSMAEAVPGTGLTRMNVTTQAATEGLSLFPEDAEIGLWEFSVRINGDLDYRETVPIRPLDNEVEGGTQHQALTTALAGIEPKPDGDTGLYDTILAAYREMSRTYKADRVNTILVLTDGNNDDEGSISLDELLTTLEEEFVPDRPVAVISIAFGPDIDPEPLERIAQVTEGAAYSTDDPTEIGDIFLQSFALRIADTGEEG